MTHELPTTWTDRERLEVIAKIAAAASKARSFAFKHQAHQAIVLAAGANAEFLNNNARNFQQFIDGLMPNGEKA